MRVFAFPKSGIAYNESFYRALEAQGVHVIEGIFAGAWLLRNVRRGDWIHLHWPSFAYSGSEGNLRLVVRFLRFVAILILVRMLGAKLAWTAHNLLPHDRCRIASFDTLGRRVVIALAEIVLVHGSEPTRILIARFPSVGRKVLTIPLGHWIGYYPCSITRDEARNRLRIPPASYVYLFVGLCKPYKNLEGLIRVFRKLPGDALLVVAGQFQEAAYHDRIKRLVADEPRIRIYAGFVPNEQLQTYLMACDIVVVPYHEILTSGTAMLAMSFGRPVVSVCLGHLRDIISDDTGILFAASDANGLERSLLESRQRNFSEQRILAHARQFSFDEAARLFATALGHRVPAQLESPKAPSEPASMG